MPFSISFRSLSRTSSTFEDDHRSLKVVNPTTKRLFSSSNFSPFYLNSFIFLILFPLENNPPPLPVSQPLKSISSLNRRSSLKDVHPGSHPNLPILVHTPATPQKDDQSKLRQPYQAHAIKGSLDSRIRYRVALSAGMGVLDEEGASLSRERAVSPPLPPLPRPPGPVKSTNSAKSTKHGSFDFERPGSSAAAPLTIQRSGSAGTSGTKISAHSREKEGQVGPGMAGVGTLQRELSMKRVQQDQSKPKEKVDRHTSSQRTTPEHVHASTSTNGTGPGKVSLSKATGKRYAHARGVSGKTGSGSGLSRLIGGHPQHGPFSFEPPVPTLASWSTGTGGSTSTTGTGYGHIQREEDREKAEREYERVQLEKAKEKERQREMKKRGLKMSGDRPPVPVPSVPIPLRPTVAEGLSSSPPVGHRSGQKGRSLDLGLGLAWAPSSVPEEALLPSSVFVRGLDYGREADSRNGSLSGRATGKRGRKDRTRDEEAQGSMIGRDVAELFRKALDVDGYRLFKHCMSPFIYLFLFSLSIRDRCASI